MFPLRAVQRLIFLGLARLLPPLNFQDLTQTKFSALISQGNEIFAPLREAHVTFLTGAVFKRFPSKSLSLTQCLVTNQFFSFYYTHAKFRQIRLNEFSQKNSIDLISKAKSRIEWIPLEKVIINLRSNNSNNMFVLRALQPFSDETPTYLRCLNIRKFKIFFYNFLEMLRYWEIANICFTRNISYLPHVFIGPRSSHSPFMSVTH